MLVVAFGLFNGLFVLPVVLSLIGPTSYKSDKDSANTQLGHKKEEEEEQPLKPIIKNIYQEQGDEQQV